MAIRRKTSQERFDEEKKRYNEILNYHYNAGSLLKEADDMDANAEEPMPSDMGNEQSQDAAQPQEPQGNQEPMGGGTMPNEEQPATEPAEEPSNEEIEDLTVETEVEEPESGDEVINVDDLTKSQEVTEYKIDCVNEKILDLMKTVDLFKKALENNGMSISALRQEIIDRMPTEEEKAQKLSRISSPFNIKPDEEKREGAEKETLVITKNDIETPGEEAIYKSFSDDTVEIDKNIPTSLQGYFR